MSDTFSLPSPVSLGTQPSTSANSFSGKKFQITHVFTENINRVWFCLRNISLISVVDPSFLSQVNLVTGKNTWTEGSEFTAYWVGISYLHSKCTKVKSEPHTKMISWNYSLDIQIDFTKTIHLYQLTNCDSTLVVLEINIQSIDQNEYIPVSSDNEVYIQIYKNFLLKIDKYMKKNPINLGNFESCVVKETREHLWDFLTDLNKVTKVSKLIADYFEYSGDRFQKGTFIKGIACPNNKTIFLRVKNVKNDVDSNVWSYSFETFGTNSNVLKQETEITIVKIDDKTCQISFLHFFQDLVTKEMIHQFSKDKLSFLQKIKEHYNNLIHDCL